MTPRDQMSQDRSYFFDPNTSGAEKKRGLTNSAENYLGKLEYIHNERALTDIVGRVTRRCQSVPCMSFLGKPKVGQLQRSILSCKDTLQVHVHDSSFPKPLTSVGEEKVFRFEISVSDVSLVQELHCLADLLHYFCSV